MYIVHMYIHKWIFICGSMDNLISVDGCLNIDSWMSRWIDRQVDRQIDGWMDGQIDRYVVGLVNAQMDR